MIFSELKKENVSFEVYLIEVSKLNGLIFFFQLFYEEQINFWAQNWIFTSFYQF